MAKTEFDTAKKTSADVKAMNDNLFLTYKHELEGDDYTALEKSAEFDAAILAFDTTRPQPLSRVDRVARAAIFTAYGRTPPADMP